MKFIRKPLTDRNQNLTGKYLTFHQPRTKERNVCARRHRDGNLNNWF